VGRWGGGGGEAPQVSTSHTGTAILRLPVPLGIQPGTFGGPVLALVSTVQPILAGRKHQPFVSALSERPLKAASVHYRPSQTIRFERM
jgi:hypothetical protein